MSETDRILAEHHTRRDAILADHHEKMRQLYADHEAEMWRSGMERMVFPVEEPDVASLVYDTARNIGDLFGMPHLADDVIDSLGPVIGEVEQYRFPVGPHTQQLPDGPGSHVHTITPAVHRRPVQANEVGDSDADTAGSDH